MRWLLLLVALLAFAGLFQAQTAGMVTLALVVGIAALVAAFFSFASARVGTVARGQDSRELDLLIQAKKTATPKPAEPPRPGPPR